MGVWYEYETYLIDKTEVRECMIGLYTQMNSDTFTYVYKAPNL